MRLPVKGNMCVDPPTEGSCSLSRGLAVRPRKLNNDFGPTKELHNFQC